MSGELHGISEAIGALRARQDALAESSDEWRARNDRKLDTLTEEIRRSIHEKNNAAMIALNGLDKRIGTLERADERRRGGMGAHRLWRASLIAAASGFGAVGGWSLISAITGKKLVP